MDKKDTVMQVIRPVMERVIALCEEHGIPVVFGFDASEPGPNDGLCICGAIEGAAGMPPSGLIAAAYYLLSGNTQAALAHIPGIVPVAVTSANSAEAAKLLQACAEANAASGADSTQIH